MNDLLSLFTIVGAIALPVVPPILLVRWLVGSGPADLSELFRIESDRPRLAGIEEEDLPAFRFDHVESPRHQRPVLAELRPPTAPPATCADERAA